MIPYLFLFLTFCFGCTPSKKEDHKQFFSKLHKTKQTILTKQQDIKPIKISLRQNKRPDYPFKEFFYEITKNHFECKGSYLNPPIKLESGEILFDCSGKKGHSLPFRKTSGDDLEEWVAPILISLLNHIQNKTEKKVIITSGHRCPQHHRYVTKNQDLYNKHQIGAKVAFYVKGLEYDPNHILEIIFDFFKNDTFSRYTKETNVETKPWYNSEVYIKLYKSSEGRNVDNQHPYPYISIQVNKDRTTNQRISYDYKTAYKSLKHY